MQKTLPAVSHTQPGYYVGKDNYKQHLVVFLHGLGGDCYELAPVAQRISQDGYSVLMIRYPGHGLSGRQMPHTTWHQWLAHAYEKIIEVADNHAAITILGFSTGCPLSVMLIQQLQQQKCTQNKVQQLVWLAPFFGLKHYPYYVFSLERWIGLVSLLTPYVPVGPLPINCSTGRYHAEKHRDYAWFSLPTIQSALALINKATAILPTIAVPISVLYSEKDRVVCTQALKKALVNNATEYTHICHSNHILCHDYNAAEVSDFVVKQLNQFP